MRHLRQLGFAALTLLVVASSASAQRRGASSTRAYPWELGVDAALSLGLDNPSVTTLQVPVGNLRVGIFASDAWEIEPFFALNYVKVEGFDAVTTYSIGSGVLYHFKPNRMQPQVYVRPFVGLVGVSTSGNSNSDVEIGGGVGMKWPRMGGRWAWRGEVNFATTGDNSSVNALWGVSLFTR